VTDYEPEIDDIKAMRAENGGSDLKAFMRQQIKAGKSRREDVPKPVIPKQPGRQPGAWPRGTSPPGPPPERQIPAHVWDAAVRHYRNEESRPDQPCDCGNCPPKETR
jgi:hypothetical protein